MRRISAAALACSGVLAAGLTAVVIGTSTTASATPIAASCQPAAYTLTSTPNAPNGWYTEDGAPAYVADTNAIDGSGELEYQTPNAGSRQNYFHLTGSSFTTGLPLSGVSGLAYSVRNSSGGPEAAYDMEILTAGTTGYTTLVWEPYLNGNPLVADGTWHHYTNLEAGKWWDTHIVSGPGSQSSPQLLSFFRNLSPSATIATYAAGQGSGNAGSTSFVDDIQFCGGATNFEPTCTTTITGTHGSVIVTSGTTCLINATITGGISVGRGASLVIENSTVNGSISASHPATVRICGSTTGAINVFAASGYVSIGDPTSNCAPNTIKGSLTAVNNTGGGTISGNTITGSWTIIGNTPPFTVAGNHH